MSKKATSRKTTAKKATASKISAKTAAPMRATTPKEKGPTEKNLDIYGAAPLPWSRALKQLEAGTAGSYWLATTNPDGRPHVAAVGALWVDGKIYFTSSTRTRKGRNLAANPDCVFSVSLTGIDLVVEGSAVRITDRPTLLRLAKRYAAQGWPASVSGEALTAEYSAPSAGPPPWNLYVMRPITAFGVATAEPSGATRWQFETQGGGQT
jgi:pyridoxamine 5'-phosphate oxidase-like protein